jgi:chemotaxis protein methyltransferase CheR
MNFSGVLMSPEILYSFSQIIEEETGIIYTEKNHHQLRLRLEELLRIEKIIDVEDLKEMITSAAGDQLRRRFMDLATNNETLFFRDTYFFEGISDFIKSEILPSRPREIKIWSAACSTGQEALSVAMLLEELSDSFKLPPYSILATDICERALTKCRSGFYTDFEVTRGLSAERRERFFTQVKGGWKPKENLLNRILFKSNNLIRPTIRGDFHLILCRNVLIYQRVEMKKQVVDYLLNQLSPQGALGLGMSETLWGIMDDVNSKTFSSAKFYQPGQEHTLEFGSFIKDFRTV